MKNTEVVEYEWAAIYKMVDGLNKPDDKTYRTYTDAELGKALRSYINESAFVGWEFNKRDMAGVRHMLFDMTIFIKD